MASPSGSSTILDGKGVFAIATTPFKAAGVLDLRSIDRLTDFYFECGASGLTILGIMGEAPKLDTEESETIIRRTIARAGGAPVVVGVSSPGFAAMQRLSRIAMDAGAAAVMIGPPPALRTDDQIVGYYAQAVEAIGADVPFVLQDHPLALTVQMAPGVIRRIVEEHPSCGMLKHEDWPGLEKLTTLRRFQEEGSMRRIPFLCGNGGLFLDCELARGADGAMTGYAFPDMLVELVGLARQGERDRAQDLFDAHLPLIRYEHQPGIGLAARKYILERRGVIETSTLRKPGGALTDLARAEIDYLLSRLARHDPRARL